mmetsp:Transcript_21199/g.44502  ORF Transcript_21199/g.44502 Transcript_21199/m.44502 type:complete len:335 (-) Transcript_21199:1086-2090(-)
MNLILQIFRHLRLHFGFHAFHFFSMHRLHFSELLCQCLLRRLYHFVLEPFHFRLVHFPHLVHGQFDIRWIGAAHGRPTGNATAHRGWPGKGTSAEFVIVESGIRFQLGKFLLGSQQGIFLKLISGEHVSSSGYILLGLEDRIFFEFVPFRNGGWGLGRRRRHSDARSSSHPSRRRRHSDTGSSHPSGHSSHRRRRRHDALGRRWHSPRWWSAHCLTLLPKWRRRTASGRESSSRRSRSFHSIEGSGAGTTRGSASAHVEHSVGAFLSRFRSDVVAIAQISDTSGLFGSSAVTATFLESSTDIIISSNFATIICSDSTQVILQTLIVLPPRSLIR